MPALGGGKHSTVQKRGGAGNNVLSLRRPTSCTSKSQHTFLVSRFRPPDSFVRAPLMWIHGPHSSPTPHFRVLSSAPTYPASRKIIILPFLVSQQQHLPLFKLPFRPPLFTCSLERRSFAVGEERLRQKVLGDQGEMPTPPSMGSLPVPYCVGG